MQFPSPETGKSYATQTPEFPAAIEKFFRYLKKHVRNEDERELFRILAKNLWKEADFEKRPRLATAWTLACLRREYKELMQQKKEERRAIQSQPDYKPRMRAEHEARIHRSVHGDNLGM
jgi:hypothetical protein